MNILHRIHRSSCVFTTFIKQSLPVIGVLRKRKRHYLAFLLVVNKVYCDRSENTMSSSLGDLYQDGKNGLLLYYHQYSYYSQKVVMALHEKNLPFESHIVNLFRNEQYNPWFLKINPRGEVPVLQDTGKIIPDSSRIIDYLEDNFSNGDTPRLIPMNLGAEVRQKVTYFRQLIDKMPSGIITMGSFFHPELVKEPKVPFIAPIRKALAKAEINSAENLKKIAEQNPDIKHVLIQKSLFQETKHKNLLNKEEYLKVLDSIDLVLNEVEKQLEKRGPEEKNHWLCCENFTIADISLTIFLERLYELGFESRFWTDGKRPNVEEYFERVRERDSYKKTIPNKMFLIKSILLQNGPIVLGVSVFAAVAIIVGGVFLFKRLIS